MVTHFDPSCLTSAYCLYSVYSPPGGEEEAGQVPEGSELDKPDQLTGLRLQLLRQYLQAAPVFHRPPPKNIIIIICFVMLPNCKGKVKKNIGLFRVTVFLLEYIFSMCYET
jgi:hypothetical protein